MHGCPSNTRLCKNCYLKNWQYLHVHHDILRRIKYEQIFFHNGFVLAQPKMLESLAL